jgi:hypothetical protein
VTAVVEARGLSKRFDEVAALDGLVSSPIPAVRRPKHRTEGAPAQHECGLMRTLAATSVSFHRLAKSS